MEACLAPDPIAIGGEAHALAGNDGIELGKGVEVLVDDGFVEVDPQRLDRLELWAVATVFQAGCLV